MGGATVQWLKQNRLVSFVEWCPTGFKIGLNSSVPDQTNDWEDVFKFSDKVIVGTYNLTAISRVITKRITEGFASKVKERHATVDAMAKELGLEWQQLDEAVEDLRFLAKDYEDVLTEHTS